MCTGKVVRETIRHIIIVAVGVIACLAAVSPAGAQGEDVPVHPANLTLFFPVGTNQDPTILTYFRLNLSYGRVGYIKGVDIGTIVNRTDRDLRGIQLTGAYSHTGNDLRGATFTGGLNYVGGSARGIQVSGLVNFNRSWFRGFQYSSLFNFTQDYFVGVQWGGIFNLANGNVKGLQISSFGNLAAGDMRGFQIGGLNYANDSVRGAQIGITNFAMKFHGAQVGVLNFAGDSKGAMIGVFNLVTELDGVPVGAINWDKTNGNADWSIFASNFALANTGLRTVVNRWVATAAVGIGDVEDERDDTLFLSWYYGYMYPLGDGEKWWITPELGYVHVMPQTSEEGKTMDLHFMLQGLVKAELKASDIVRVFVGGGVNVRFSEYSTQAASTTDPLVIGGVALW
jgi:hypothetical protein